MQEHWDSPEPGRLGSGQACPARWWELSFEEGRLSQVGQGGQKDRRRQELCGVGSSQGRTETDQGAIVSVREGVADFTQSQRDAC